MDKTLILNEIKKHENITTNKGFAEFLGIKPTTLSMWYKRNSMDIELLFKKCEYLNPEWLLTGKGEMLKSNAGTVAKPIKKGIPLVTATAVGGFGGNSFAIQERDIKAYYTIPKFNHKKVDFMIEVEGSSMYPKYNSGDVVACTNLKESSFIQWNKTHVIATKDQGIIIKRIKKGYSDDCLCMVSDNENYDPFEVPKEEITGIALVVGVIRLE